MYDILDACSASGSRGTPGNTAFPSTASSPRCATRAVPLVQENGSLYYLGRDTAGRLTEVVAVEADNGDLIITHAMPKEWKR